PGSPERARGPPGPGSRAPCRGCARAPPPPDRSSSWCSLRAGGPWHGVGCRDTRYTSTARLRSGRAPLPAPHPMSILPPFRPFELEHYQSLWEHTVEVNLADSSVKCVDTGSWLEPEEREELLRTPLFYPQVNGLRALRERIAGLYADTGPDEVLVTVGASQANHPVAHTLLRPGDGVVVLTPGYRQIAGLAANPGCRAREVPHDPARDWRLDLDALDEAVGAGTRLVAVVNPNNPTGHILEAEEMERIVAACARVGAWLHADEVYHGTELERSSTPSFRGRYDRLVV